MTSAALSDLHPAQSSSLKYYLWDIDQDSDRMRVVVVRIRAKKNRPWRAVRAATSDYFEVLTM